MNFFTLYLTMLATCIRQSWQYLYSDLDLPGIQSGVWYCYHIKGAYIILVNKPKRLITSKLTLKRVEHN